MSSSCINPNYCRGGCCRSFLGTDFCDVESNCITVPTWLIALVPIMLGVAAIILILIVLVRLKNRKVIDINDKIANAKIKNQNKMQNMKNNLQQAESDRNMIISDRPLRQSKI